MQPFARPRPTGWRVRPREQRTILLMGDLLAGFLALAAALYIWSLRDQWVFTFFSDRVKLWYYFLPFVWMVLLAGIYDSHRASNWRSTLQGIAMALLAGLLCYAVIYLFYQGALARIGIGLFLFFTSILTLIWRLVYIQMFTAQAFMRRVLVVGAGKAGETLVQAYNNLRPQPFFLVGFMDDNPKKIGKKLEGFPILAANDHLLDIIEKEDITEIVVAINGEMQGSTFQSILDAQERGLEIVPMPTLYEELMGRVPIHHLETDWLIHSFVDETRVGGFYEAGKRLLDILASLIGLGICILIYPFVALVTLIDSGTPIMYKQIRSGKGGRPYLVHKFRTMRQDAEKDGKAQLTQENDDRITLFGNFMRRSHIDEFPQFWSVLRGEMSLVGPRSERPEWVSEFQKQIPFYRARLLVKPGITGWAQVNYSYYATVEEMAIKLEYDLYYIKHRNLLMDILIILRTITQMVTFRGR